MTKAHLLFLVILIEGYVVLACELLAIRELIPFVGSGTDVISIIISAVLLPLAVGYHAGGHVRRGTRSIRHILLKNILWALAIFAIGLSYPLMEIFFTLLTQMHITHRLAQTAIYVSLFLVVPVFLLGQTVPLISNYFSRRRLSEITGKMLFFSTAGSFLGSVFSTLVLMTFFGVHITVILTLGLLTLLCFLLARKRKPREFAALIFVAVLVLNNGEAMRGIVSNNAYNTISVRLLPNDEGRILNINRSNSSKISEDLDKMFPYIAYIEQVFIAPLSASGTTHDILVIGAGGFTIGLNDTTNHYTYVDIDPDLKRVAEAHFLPKLLTPNKQFVAASARAFVHNDKQHYDFIVIDVFTNIFSIPMEATSREFLLDVKNLLKPDSILIANVIGTAAMRDKFSARYNNTFASVFPSYTRQIIGNFMPWPGFTSKINGGIDLNNLLYIYFNTAEANDRTVYTDDKNTYSLDRN
jgi:hypothetical protein